MIIKKLKSIIARWAHDDENKRLREKLRMYKGYLRAANKGAESNNRVSQLSAARNSQLHVRIAELEDRLNGKGGLTMRQMDELAQFREYRKLGTVTELKTMIGHG
jgi:secreted Zn-dependent insulinase-like peptidase